MPDGHKVRVLEHLQKHGSITSMDAINEYGNTRLSDTIFRLRKDGWKIETVSETRKNRYGRPVTYARYVLEGGRR